ncbi:glycosyltransferase [Saccharobesus litoralis]|uniref:Glycosyltransferase n=1 Tax=Saccharobesus litoralis TaxID=2172099 RepID=A0A2S0VRM5_9ALTE|nr:glycosyltransferase family 2 protein [Saccharobesus litoralis]AWB66843.1 glycosyltransferase [Saccharobesus litoralis]
MSQLSIVVPLYKEEETVTHLVKAVHSALESYPSPWELICVDDGSPDNTLDELNKAKQQWGEHVRIIELQRNFGQTAAMQAGIDAARGEIIVTMDGDLQNDPADIPRLVTELQERDLDMLQGWRQNRKDNLLWRKIPSRIANRLIANITGVKLHDYGCSLKAYRASVIKQIRLFGEMHRFIPVWVASVTKPNRIGETIVKHNARQFGESKYGISRTFRVVLDLLAVFFFLKFRARPGHFFGYLGLTMGAIGGLIMSWMATVKFILGEDIGNRPLFFVGIFLLVASLQFLTTGVLAEMLSRVFFHATNAKGYSLRTPNLVNNQEQWYVATPPNPENNEDKNNIAQAV